jgi:hypothetical protein
VSRFFRGVKTLGAPVGKHGSEYPRVERDHYPTPEWPIAALGEHIELRGQIAWEMACGDGGMAKALLGEGCARVYATDIIDRGNGQDAVFDFLSPGKPKRLPHCNLLATNPPFGLQGRLAVGFIEAGLRRLPIGGTLALLLPNDFDSGKTRVHVFRDCPHFVGKITLTRRVKWFVHPGKEKVTPRENSAWFLWQRNLLIVRREPIVLYGPKP